MSARRLALTALAFCWAVPAFAAGVAFLALGDIGDAFEARFGVHPSDLLPARWLS